MHDETSVPADAAAPTLTPFARRRALQLLGGAGLLALVTACRTSDSASPTSDSTGSPGTTAAAGSSTTALASGAASDASPGAEIPDETAGPYPGDGSNGPDVLTQSGVVRQDIRSSFGSSSGPAPGTDMTLRLTVVDPGTGRPRPGVAVYAWHCDAAGAYSIYGQGLEGENYLRGVQEADDGGELSFVTVFPGAYSGRWPHVHFEVYESVADATGGGQPIKTTQLALPREACEAVYATAGYESSAANLAQLSLDTDMVFSDGYDDQLATVEGTTGEGLTASLLVRV